MRTRFPKLKVAGLILLVAGLAACQSTNRVPRFDLTTGKPEQYKRYAYRNYRDYLYRWNAQAYAKVEEPMRGMLSEDMKDVLARHGQPDYRRDPFKAETDELVEDWVYWDRGVITQFVQGQLVYEGPLTDQDRCLVQYGYPQQSFSQQYEGDVSPRRETWVYKRLFERRGTFVSFTDGKLVARETN